MKLKKEMTERNTHNVNDPESGVITYEKGEWTAIDKDDNSWEYQEDPNDVETYISGNFITDEDNPKKVIDYDGCYAIPDAVIFTLEEMGYDCEEIK